MSYKPLSEQNISKEQMEQYRIMGLAAMGYDVDDLTNPEYREYEEYVEQVRQDARG